MKAFLSTNYDQERLNLDIDINSNKSNNAGKIIMINKKIGIAVMTNDYTIYIENDSIVNIKTYYCSEYPRGCLFKIKFRFQ